MDVEEYNVDTGYNMGVFLCLGQPIHSVSLSQAISIDKFGSFQDIHQYMSENGKVFILLGSGVHKIKKKAEQMACESAIQKTF